MEDSTERQILIVANRRRPRCCSPTFAGAPRVSRPVSPRGAAVVLGCRHGGVGHHARTRPRPDRSRSSFGRLAGAGVPGAWTRFSTPRTPAILRVAASICSMSSGRSMTPRRSTTPSSALTLICPFGGLPLAQAWVESAVERAFIAKTGGSNEATRYNIMAAGRNAGVRTGRFVVSEKARDGEPSRRF